VRNESTTVLHNCRTETCAMELGTLVAIQGHAEATTWCRHLMTLLPNPTRSKDVQLSRKNEYTAGSQRDLAKLLSQLTHDITCAMRTTDGVSGRSNKICDEPFQSGGFACGKNIAQPKALLISIGGAYRHRALRSQYGNQFKYTGP
jgi:hypothetical protein